MYLLMVMFMFMVMPVAVMFAHSIFSQIHPASSYVCQIQSL